MSDPFDFSRLSANWLFWAPRAGLTNAQVVGSLAERDVWFRSDDYSVLLRNEGGLVIDTVDDRGQRHNDTANFTSYVLAEKFLIWQWASAARNVQRLPRIGPKLNSLGHNPDVQFTEIREGIYELRTSEGHAILMEPAATIYSHLMLKSPEEIEQMVKDGIS